MIMERSLAASPATSFVEATHGRVAAGGWNVHGRFLAGVARARPVDGMRVLRCAVALIAACGAPELTPDGAVREPDGSLASPDARRDPPIDATPPSPSHAASCLDGEPGVWQAISPPDFDFSQPGGGQTNFGSCAIAMDPSDPATLYAGFDGAGVWKSRDCGGTWARVDSPSSGFTNWAGANCAFSMAVDPSNPQTIYANNGYGGGRGVFKSVNGGVDWTQGFGATSLLPDHTSAAGVFHESFNHLIAMDPTNPLHLVLTPHFECDPPHSVTCMLETFDGMDTWRVIENTPNFNGGEGLSFYMMDSTNWLRSSADGERGGLYRTQDGGASWTAVPGVDRPYATIYRASSGVYYLPSLSGIYRSDDAITWTLIPDSMRAGVITGDGTRMYSTWGFPGFATPEYGTALEADGVWSPLRADATNGAAAMSNNASSIIVDPVNQFLYSTNSYAGLWRMSTRGMH